MNKNLKRQKGITLIALIITIIVMLILTGVSVSVALKTGLFKIAQGAVNNTQIAINEEIKLSEGTINTGREEINISDYIDKLPLIPSELKIGDTIEYTPVSSYTASDPFIVSNEDTADLKLAGCSGSFYTDMDNTVEWKVIGIQGNSIKIIPNAVSDGTLKLEGAHGWNNSIDAINAVCEAIYGNTTNDKYTATATGLTIEEINKITGYTPPTTTESYNASGFGSSNKFPIEYLKEKGVTSFTDTDIENGYAENSSLTVERTSYVYVAEGQENFNTKFANWVRLDRTYWLASRCVFSYASGANFGVRFGGSIENVSYDSMLLASTGPAAPEYNIRPVVFLTPKIEPTLTVTEEGNHLIFE